MTSQGGTVTFLTRCIIKACALFLKIDDAITRHTYEIVAGERWPEEWSDVG